MGAKKLLTVGFLCVAFAACLPFTDTGKYKCDPKAGGRDCTALMDGGGGSGGGTGGGPGDVDAGVEDAGEPDGGFDAGDDAGFEPTHDGGDDAGFDSGVDAGFDAGPGDSGVGRASFCAGVAFIECVKEIQAGLLPADAGIECLNYINFECQRRFGMAVDAGWPLWNDQAAGKCLTAMGQSPVERFADSWTSPPSALWRWPECSREKLFILDAGLGEPCVSDGPPCRTGFCPRVSSGNCPVCTAYSDAGAPCGAGCDPKTHFCHLGTFKCTAIVDAGTPCLFSSQCGPQGYCRDVADAGAARVCTRKAATGTSGVPEGDNISEPCLDPGAVWVFGQCLVVAPYSTPVAGWCSGEGQCGPGLRCPLPADGGLVALCAPRRTVGQPCTRTEKGLDSEAFGPMRNFYTSDDCALPLRCRKGADAGMQCLPLLDAGALSPVGEVQACQRFMGPDSTGRCAPFLKPGDACTFGLGLLSRPCYNTTCATLLSSTVCTQLVPSGNMCTTGWECASTWCGVGGLCAPSCFSR